MACCAAIALVISLVRGLWFRIVPGARPLETAFAPPARRPLGGVPAAPAVRRSPRRTPIGPAVLTGVALGTVLYTAAVAGLLATGVAAARSGADWLPRDIAQVVLAAGAVALAQVRRWVDPSPASTVALITGVGLAWAELGLVDMHVWRLFTFPHAATVLDLAFHGSGFALVALSLPRLLHTIPRAAAA